MVVEARRRRVGEVVWGHPCLVFPRCKPRPCSVFVLLLVALLSSASGWALINGPPRGAFFLARAW